MERTVTPLAYAYVGSNPTPPTSKTLVQSARVFSSPSPSRMTSEHAALRGEPTTSASRGRRSAAITGILYAHPDAASAHGYPLAMAETLIITPERSRAEGYRELLPQLLAMIEAERDTIATLANVSAALHHAFAFHWVGFYLVKQNELVLGPFQGPIACTRIAHNKGVCGTAWATNTTQLVPDVAAFPGHIACSSQTQSEIVVPLRYETGNVWAVLDVDSDKPDDFSDVDRDALEQLASWLTRLDQSST